MKNTLPIFLLMVSGAVFAVAFLAFAFWRKAFLQYRRRAVSVAYWSITCFALVGAMAAWTANAAHPLAAGALRFFAVWLMAQLFLLVLSAALLIARKVVWRKAETPFDPQRRRLLQTAAAGLPLAALGASAYGTFRGSEEIVLLRHDTPLAGLAPELDGYRLAQVSDVHIGLFFSVEELRALMDRLLAHAPDALVITGDLIDDLGALPDLVAAIDAYSGRFPDGIWFSWGNHEHIRGFATLEKAFAGSALRVLRNENALLKDASTPLYLLGVDYPWAREAEAQRAECAQMLERALDGAPQAATKILLSHHPRLIDDAFAAKLPLTLTGHTHGGQVAVFGALAFSLAYKYLRGMYKSGDCLGYVSAGAGSWFPFRLGCPAEAAVFTLRRK